MGDSSITKVESRHSPHGDMGQVYLASGKSVSMRLWQERPGQTTEQTIRDYETVGYVIEGTAEFESEGQLITLGQGDSWVVPRGARHRYRIIDEFLAVEATSPPAQCTVGTSRQRGPDTPSRRPVEGAERGRRR